MAFPLVRITRSFNVGACEAMSLQPHTLALADSTRLKLRGSALLAEGGAAAAYEAAVLFHEAARAETRALAALAAPSAEIRLRSAIERCGCLIDGRDPSAVIELAWPEVLELSDEVSPTIAQTLRMRLDARMKAFLREYRGAVGSAPDFLRRMRTPGKFSSRAARQLDQLLRQFPGDPRLWTMKAFNAVGDDDAAKAIEYARRSQKLLLEDGGLGRIEEFAHNIEAILSAKTLPLPDAQAAFDASYARARFGPANSANCFAVVAAGLVLAERTGQGSSRNLWERIADAALKGASLPDAHQQPYEPFFRAARMIASEKLADRRPSLEILYRAGLGTAVSHSTSTDPISILSSAMTGILLPSAA
jgi:hypothetical protein